NNVTNTLQDGGTYYLIKTGNGVYKLAGTADDAKNGRALTLTLDGTTGTAHSFTAPKLDLVPPQQEVKTVDPSTDVNSTDGTIKLTNTGFADQQAVVYHTGDSGDVAIGYVSNGQTLRLQDGGTYYLIKTSTADTYKLAATLANAQAGNALQLTNSG